MHLVTTGATYPSSHKLLGDLFSETLDRPEAVLPRALELAHEIVTNTSTVSLALMKDMMWRGPTSAEATHLLDSRIIFELTSMSDNAEGVQAFLEKRPVRFTGTLDDDAPSTWPWWDRLDVSSQAKAAKTKL